MSYKVKQKSKLDVFLKLLFVVFIVALVIFCIKVVFSSAPVVQETAAAGETEDVSVLEEEFKADTYGGIAMNSEEDAVKYYVEAYNKTKAETATYHNDDGEQTWYAFVGEEKLSINKVLIEGKENSMINNIVPGIVDGLFAANAYGLPPATNKNPNDDIDENNESFTQSRITVDDVLAVNVKDNNDGTITMTIQPKASSMSHRGMDSQGKFFNTLGAIDATVDQISVLSWASGTTADNCLVDYKGGKGVVTIDTKTGKITTADYDMEVTVQVNHANVTVIKDKNANVTITYAMHFPASDEYLLKNCHNAKRG